MPNKYPVAERPNPANAAKTIECSHCRAPIALINMTLLVRHHVDLDRHPVATRAF